MIEEILDELNAQTVASHIEQAHLHARSGYVPPAMIPQSFSEFTDILGAYYAYHLNRCVARGGAISPEAARSAAKDVIERCYGKSGENLLSAYQDAHYGTNGGLRKILDLLAAEMREASVRHHVRDTFDHWAPPVDWEGRVDLVQEFLFRFGNHLPAHIRNENPARYARDANALIQTYSYAFDDLRRWIDVMTP